MKFCLKLPILFSFTIFFSSFTYSQWVQQTSPTSSKLEALYFIDASVGFTSSSNVSQMYKTVNGGQSWTALGNYPARDIHFVDATNGFASSAAGSANGTMKKTTNGGTTWSQITPPNSSAYLGVFATSATTVYFINTEDKVIKTTNAGASLSSYTIPLTNSGSQILTDIYFPNATTGVITAQGGQIFRTTNSGTSWTSIPTGFTSALNSVCFVSSTLGYVAGNGGKVLKTTDGGATWIDKSAPSTFNITTIKFYDANNGLAVCLSGKIIKTNDGGDTWVEQASGTTNHLWNVFYLNATSAVIVGDAGTILKNDNVLSFDEFEKENSLVVFPNPTKNILNIKFKNNNEISKVDIYNSIGQLILVVSNVNENTSIDTSSFASGTYFIKMITNQGDFHTTFIKE